MAINPEEISTIRIDQLPNEPITLSSKIAHSIGTELKQGTINELVNLISTAIGTTDAVGFYPLSVTDGQQLPSVPENSSFFLCGAGTYLNINGYSNVVCTGELNVVMSLSDHWELAVEIPIVAELGVQSVTGSAVDNTDPQNPVINTSITSVSFIDLTDAPSNYSGQAGKVVKVKSSEDGLEFDAGGGSGSQDIDQTLANGSVATDKTITLIQTPDDIYDVLKTEFMPGATRHTSKEVGSSITYESTVTAYSLDFFDGNEAAIIFPPKDGLGNILPSSLVMPETGVDVEIIATREYVDNKVAGLLDLRGNYDASVNAFPTTGGSGTSGAILKGDFWYVSVAGVLNGVTVNIGDSFFALIDSPTASDWQILESNLGYVPEDVANKATTMTGNTTSNIVYLTAKAIYDWGIGLIVDATSSVKGIMKLYTSTGSNTDGTMTQNAITTALDAKEIKRNGIVSTSEKTLTNTTSAQAIYDADLDAEANCAYEIFGSADFTGLAVVSSYLSFSLLGTATIDSFNITVFAVKQSNNQPQNMSTVTSNGTQITSNSAVSIARLMFFGTVRVSGAGTVKPSVAFSSATASMKVSANAKFSFNKIGSNTVTNY